MQQQQFKPSDYKVEWNTLPIELQSRFNLIDGKYIDSYSNLGEHVFLSIGHDRYTYRIVLGSKTKNKFYSRIINSEREGDLLSVEIIIYLMNNSCEHTAQEFGFI